MIGVKTVAVGGIVVNVEILEERRGRIVNGPSALVGRFVRNVFCATGPGGGVDPTCSAGGITPQQLKAVGGYKNAGYGHVNRGLRTGRLDDRDRDTVATLDALTAASRTTTPVTVYRGYGSRMLITDNGFPADPKPGDTFTDKAFVSTTTDRAKAEKWSPRADDVTATVHVPKGVGAAPLDRYVTGQAEENEVLLERGLTFRVKSRTPKPGGDGFHLELEVVPPKPTRKKSKTPTRNVFCATGTGGGIDPTCPVAGSSPSPRKQIKVGGQSLTVEIGKDGRATVVEGPKEMIGKTFRRKESTAAAPTAPPQPPPVKEKPSAASPPPPPPKAPAQPAGPPAAFATAAEAEAHYRGRYHVALRKGSAVSEAEFLEAAAHLARETDRLSTTFPLVAKAVARRKSTPGQELEVGEAGHFKGQAEAGKYTAFRGIRLDKAGIDPKAVPDVGGGRHTTGTDLGSVYRHELGHEVWETALPRAAQSAWIRMYDKSYAKGTEVSNYGGTHPNELWSEAFSAYTSANYKAGSLPADIEKFMAKALGAGPTTNAQDDEDETWNVFCPTGKGGGTDPTCSPGGQGGADADEDWQPVRGPKGSQRLWQNRHEGRLRYSDTRPRGRTPEERKRDDERRDTLLQLPASVAQTLGGGGRGSAVVVKDWEESWGLKEGTALKLVGNMPGSLVTASADRLGSAYLAVGHPDVTSWDRQVRVDNDGRLTVYNAQFFLRPSRSGTGFGTDVFTSQVRGAIDAGATVISTTAGKGRAMDGSPMNGYSTWPRLGYDADLEDSQRRRLPPSLKGARTVLDLYETKEGRDWWKQHGSMMSMQFDVTPGSRSLKTLNAYLESKGKAPIDFPAEKWAETTRATASRKGRLDEGKREQELRNAAYATAYLDASRAGLAASPYWTGAEADAAEMVGRIHNPEGRIPRREVMRIAWNVTLVDRATRRLQDRLNAMAFSSAERREEALRVGRQHGDVLFEADEGAARRRLFELLGETT